jgi:hypothetical protein
MRCGRSIAPGRGLERMVASSAWTARSPSDEARARLPGAQRRDAHGIDGSDAIATNAAAGGEIALAAVAGRGVGRMAGADANADANSIGRGV